MFASVPITAPLAIDENLVSPGLMGLIVVAALGVALFLLIRSMNKQISRIQAPKEQELKQAEWEERQAKQRPDAAKDQEIQAKAPNSKD
ncbi:MAG: hypothetical protein JWO67_3907 [Streptosporangiaceae bacterium]|nr:hypothetical protein [Streptosporangiaceae bacterium]